MLLDHIDKVFHLDIDLFTFVGRISFPLFAFAFAESSHKTIHTKKRLERLLITAFLSEPCYSFSLNINQWIRVKQGTEIKCLSLLSDIGFKNVLFLFLISYLFIIWKRRYQPKCFFQIILFAIALILSEILHTDYGAWGILLIVGLYFCNNKEQSIFLIFVWNTLFYLGYASWNGISLMWYGDNVSSFYIFQWLFSCMSIPFILFYDGRLGRKETVGFYIFYPLHLLCLGIIREIIFNGYPF